MENFLAHRTNWSGKAEKVDYFAGATVLWNSRKENSGTTIGNYINISSWETLDGTRIRRRHGFEGRYNEDRLFIHEFGHYVQARQFNGITTLFGGINGMISTLYGEVFNRPNFHDETWWEKDASQRGLQYFIKTDRLDISDPSVNNFVQNSYLTTNPSAYVNGGNFLRYLVISYGDFN